ncbi:hypothetical protein Desde_2908 [Desulfitobacterium dehalogenans ATCC 51507]|uniref:Uncharacterized protein n=1 Tax=Desulfitobacterium dehalogenans (strain ATCC 51507 / DSM 9161 / JW/IU-DC1) TaxID=756499 RepID=I4AB76_DESDJ|nr:hypothetical protein [Desulfitobacterium dehalogenans]AFM01211.1 hypothetical protein Desde_2908 [Desulfitobacterium dehalogenans ATCC 51507]
MKRIKQFLVVALMTVIVAVAPMSAFAQTEAGQGISDLSQEKIDMRMKAVFEYLDENAYLMEEDSQEPWSFSIPVDEGVIVDVKITNQEDLKARGDAVGRNTYNVTSYSNYNYTLTVSNVLGYGDTTLYKVNYTVGGYVGSTTYHYITVNQVTISGTPPTGYNGYTTSTYIDQSLNGGIIVPTSGSITYTSPILANKKITFREVSINSIPNDKVDIDYWYEY